MLDMIVLGRPLRQLLRDWMQSNPSLWRDLSVALLTCVLQSRREGMDMQEILRWSASVLTIIPGIVIAARVRSLWTGWAFVALTGGALIWIAVASLAHDYALLAQNIAITLINSLGIYRWLIWKGNG